MRRPGTARYSGQKVVTRKRLVTALRPMHGISGWRSSGDRGHRQDGSHLRGDAYLAALERRGWLAVARKIFALLREWGLVFRISGLKPMFSLDAVALCDAAVGESR